MITALKIFIGWPGTWLWACRQMKEGRTVYRLRDSGIVKFTYDAGGRKIYANIWWETSLKGHEWGVNMEDVFATDFKLLSEKPDYNSMHKQSQMKIK